MTTTTDWIVVGVTIALILFACWASTKCRDKIKKHMFNEFEKYDGYKDKEDEK